MSEEHIDPREVRVIEEKINPDEVKVYGGGFFGPKRSDWNRMRAMFSGEDPYAAATSPENRQQLEASVNLMPDPDAERRKIAVTAYMSRMKRENVSFVYDNLDKILEEYYGKKTSVDEAFKDIGGMLLKGRGEDGSGTGNEIYLAAGSGLAGAADFALSIGKFLARYAVPHDVTKENPFENLLKRAKEPVSDYRATLSEGAKTKTIAEAWKAGETDANLIKLVAEEGPALALQIGTVLLTGGSGPFLMGGVFTEEKREQLLKENPEMSLGQMGANLAMTYIINTFDSIVDMKVLKGASAPVRKEMTESIFYALKHIFKPVLIEGGTEGLQRLAENGADYITGVYDKEIASGANVSDLLVRGVPEEALLGAISGAGMSAFGFRTVRDVDRMNNVLLSTVDTEIEKLRDKETPSDEDISTLHELEELRDAGNAEGMRSVLAQRAIREYNRSRQNAEEAKEAEDAEDAEEAGMTDDDEAKRYQESYRLRKQELAHNPQDTEDAVIEESRLYPSFGFATYEGAENMPAAARKEALRLGYSPRGVDALILGDTCYINTARLRPSDVPKRVLEEVAGHRGLRAVFGEQYDSMLDGVYRDFFREEEFQKIAKRYFRADQLDAVENQRYATEEFLAHNARMKPELKPSWWKEFLQKIKMALRKLPGFQNLRFTDRELERILMRGIAAVRDTRAYQTNRTDRDVRFAAALRREGAPNHAMEKGKIVIGDFPHVSGFMEWVGLEGQGLYADAEMLMGKHHEYFEDQVHALAAAAFVLNAPEKAHDVNNNLAFVRKDEKSGKYFRVEIRKKVSGKRNQIRSVHELNEQQYEKAKAGIDFPVLQPSSTGSGNGVQQTRNYSDFVHYYTSKYPDVKFSVSPVWTGSAANYDAPSLNYVGTGEGAQVYGWGLYGSSSEDVARWYAKKDAERKHKSPGSDILLDGKKPEWGKDDIVDDVLFGVVTYKGDISELLEWYRKTENDSFLESRWRDRYRACREWLEENKDRIQYIDSHTGRNLYKQTFWPGKEENLLDWDKPVPEDQRRKIEEQLKAEGLYVDGDPDKASAEYRELKKRKNAGEDIPEKALDEAYEKAERLHAQRNVTGPTINGDIPSGSMVYENLEDIVGEPKAVSEFLSRAGIDGVTYIGGSSGVRNYVAFSDKDIRVDEHIRFSLQDEPDMAEYSLETAAASKAGYRVERVNENAGREFNAAKGVIVQPEMIYKRGEVPKEQPRTWLRNRCMEYVQTHHILGEHDAPALGDGVKVTVGSVKAVLNHPGSDIKNNLIAVIPDLLKDAVLIQMESNGKSKTYLLAAKVRYGENDRFIAGMVIHENQGKFYYDHELVEIENADIQSSLPMSATGVGFESASVINVIQNALFASGFEKKDGRNIRFSLNQYSDADWRDMVGYMKAKVGTLLTKPDADYRRILEEAGMECFSDADAHVIAAEAMEANQKDHRERRREAMIDWLMKNNLWFQRLAEATGTPDFVIRPSFRFQGEEFTGSYISRAWVEYSDKPNAKNRESKLKKAPGYHSYELAQMIADKYGGDATEIENEMIEYFRHKKRRASKTDRENGEKGFFDEYDEFRKEERLFNKELDRQAEAQWLAEESLRVEQTIAEIIENRQAVDEALAKTDRNVFSALYQRVMKDAAPRKPTPEQLDALNAALYDSGDPGAFVRGWKAGRDQAIAEKRREHIEFVGKVLHEKADALKLQRDAAAFAEKHVPKELRGEFIRGIVGLADYSTLPSRPYPNGKRKAKLEELFEKMIERGEEVRKAKLIEQTERLFRQAGLRADAGRKQRNVLSFEVQKAVDRIREYADMTLEEAGIRAAELQTEIENTEAEGNMSADLEYETRLLDLFGDYRNKSASEIELAYRELKALVSVGRSEMKEKIHGRARDMMTKQTEIRSGLLNGKKELSPQERRALEAKRKRAKISRSLQVTLWQSNSLDSLLSYLPLPSGRESGIIKHLQERLHTAYSDKMTRNRHHTDDLEAKLNELAGLDRSANGLNARKVRAELIRKWRERPEHTGIMRHQPDDKTKFAEWIRVPETEARAKLEEFRRSGRDFEAAALEHLLNTEKLRIRKPGSSLFGDSVTDALVDEMRKKRDEDTEKAYHVPVLKLGFNPVEENLTQLEALYMKLMWNQRNIRYKMRFNGWTESSIRQIDAYLRPEVAAFGEWMTMQLEKDRSDISQVYERLYFSMFPHEENYFPSVFNQTRETMDGKITLDLSEEGAGGKPMACTPGAVKLRAFHLMEPRVCDALTIFVNHRQQMDHFVTHGETARELRSLFLNKDVAQTIRDVYGNEFYDQLKKEISDFIAGGNVQNQNTQFAQFALNNWARVKMLWNVTSAGKQMFGGLSYFQFSGVPSSAMVSGIADFWKHPIGNAKRLMETEYFKNRWQGGMNRELKMIMDSTGLCAGNFSLFMREMDHWGFMAMRGGDAFAVLAYGHAVYKYHYDQLIKRGMAPHEADRQAKTEWAIATERTQQSGATHMLNSWQKGNFAQKALVTFLSNPTLLFQSYSRDIYSSVKFGTGKWPAAKKLAVSGILSLIMAGITQLMRHGVEWDEYDLEDVVFATLADQTTGWVGVGTILNAAYSAMGGSPAKSMPVLDEVGRAVRSGYRVGQALKEDDLSEENFRDALNILQGLGLFWAPAAQVGSIGREIRRLWRIVAGEERR